MIPPRQLPVMHPFQRFRLLHNWMVASRSSCLRMIKERMKEEMVATMETITETACWKLWMGTTCKPLLPMPAKESCRVMDPECVHCIVAFTAKFTKRTWSMATNCGCTSCLPHPTICNLRLQFSIHRKTKLFHHLVLVSLRLEDTAEPLDVCLVDGLIVSIIDWYSNKIEILSHYQHLHP